MMKSFCLLALLWLGVTATAGALTQGKVYDRFISGGWVWADILHQTPASFMSGGWVWADTLHQTPASFISGGWVWADTLHQAPACLFLYCNWR